MLLLLAKKKIQQILNVISSEPYWNLVSLLLRAAPTATTGANNSTFLDSSEIEYSVTRTGNTTQGSFSPFPDADNIGSIYFDGTGDYLSFPYSKDFEVSTVSTTGDFTIEAWVYRNAVGANHYIATNRPASAAEGWAFFINATNQLSFAYTGGGVPVSTATIPLNVWTHVAASRSGQTLNLFVNGVLDGTNTSTGGTNVSASSPFYIGRDNGGTGIFNGYISNFRMVKGTSLYSSTFTPPSTALTAVAGTTLLLLGKNSSIIDYATKNTAETVTNASASTVQTLFGNPTIRLATSADYITLPASEKYIFGTGDFTMEFWFRADNLTTTQQFVIASWISPYPFGIDVASNAVRLNLNGTVIINATGLTLTSNTWYHVAATRKNGQARLFVAGVQVGATTANATDVTSKQQVCIGNKNDNFGSPFVGYLQDVRITKGHARYINNFSVPTDLAAKTIKTDAADSNYDQVVIHNHFENINASTNIVDQKGQALTISGATISTTASKFGTTSLSIPTSGYVDYTTNTAYSFANDFTVEGWFNLTSVTNAALFSLGSTDAAGRWLVRTASSVLQLEIFGPTVVITGPTLTAATWYHVALVRKNGIVKVFVNGTAYGAYASTAVPTSTLRLGLFASVVFTGYIDEVRVTNGVARYTTDFSVPTAAFPDYQDFTSDKYLGQSIEFKSLVTQGNNNTILDGSTNNFTITRNGNVAQGTFSPFSNSGFSTYFAAAGEQLTIPDSTNVACGTGDFTWECWINPNVVTTGLLYTKRNSSATAQFHVALSGGQVQFLASTNGSSWDAFSVLAGSVKIGQWCHIAVVRSGNNTTGYINGVGTLLRGTAWTPFVNSAPVLIGSDVSGGSGSFSGYMSNQRFVKGTAVYTANFTPSTSSRLTAVAGTGFLIFQDNRLKDNSANNYTVTQQTGNVSIIAHSPFVPATYSTGTNGGSMYFDGTGDYLTISSGKQPTLAGDFTVECWVFDNSAGTAPSFIQLGGAAVNTRLAVYTNNMDFYAGGVEFWTGLHIKNQWVHYAMTRSGTTVRCFQNGVQFATGTKSGACGSATIPTVVGGLEGGAYLHSGYISDARVIDGTSLYNANFIPPTAPLTPVANTKLLLSGTNAAIVDGGGKVNIETLTGAKADLVNKQYNNAISLTASNIIIPASPRNALVGDYTVEAWIYPTSLAADFAIFGNYTTPAATDWLIKVTTTGAVQGLLYGSTSRFTSVAGQIVVNKWQHIALTRVGSNHFLYVDGISLGTYSNATTLGDTTKVVGVGSLGDGTQKMTGFMEDFRFTNGVGRYLSGFTVPLAPLPPVLTAATVTPPAATYPTIANSLRFNATPANQYLTRTFGQPTNRDKWTFHAKVKLSSLTAAYRAIFGSADNSNFISFNSSGDTLYVSLGAANTFTSSRVFRDPSAWYYLTFAYDGAATGATSRMRVFLNNEELTASTDNRASITASNYSTFNSAAAHYIGRTSSGAGSYDGYFSDVHFVDGQALTSSSFGQTDTNGVWVPKTYSGTYGNNGFKLGFADGTSTTTLGYDTSGNANHWTLTGMTRAAGVNECWMTDTPTNNYATLNRVAEYGTIGTMGTAEGNLVSSPGGATQNKGWMSTMQVTSGKWYFETTFTTTLSDNNGGVALITGSGIPGETSDPTSIRYADAGNWRQNGVSSSTVTAINTNDVLMCAFDVDASKVWFGKNGTWFASGNPVNGTSPLSTTCPNPAMPASYHYNNNAITKWNFGQRAFAYTPPTGFNALCTSNLPAVAIAKPKLHFDAVAYNGAAAAKKVPGMSFKPDLVWAKSRSLATANGLFDSVRGVNQYMSSNATTAEATLANSITAFNVNGFSLGSDTTFNAGGATFISWNWKASNAAGVSNTNGTITSTVSANATAGFSIVSYTGNGTTGTVGHGLGVAPKMVIIKNRASAIENWPVWHSALANTEYLALNLTIAKGTGSGVWNNTTPTSSIFSVGTSNGVNASATNMLAYCFAEIAGYSKFGSYTGNSSADGPFVYCGFKPRYVLIKRTDATADWTIFDTARNTVNGMDLELYTDLASAESAAGGIGLDCLANGFKLRRAGGAVNVGTYIFAAFAEQPFGGSNVAPSPAR